MASVDRSDWLIASSVGKVMHGHFEQCIFLNHDWVKRTLRQIFFVTVNEKKKWRLHFLGFRKLSSEYLCVRLPILSLHTGLHG